MARRKKELPNELMILTLQAGMASELWGIIMQIAQANVSTLEAQIISKVVNEQSKTEFSDLEIDRLRDKRGYLIELMKTPEKLIGKLQHSEITIEEFDPYYKTAKDVIADRRKPRE